MTAPDFLKRYARALEVAWKGPPDTVARAVRRQPALAPVPPIPSGAVEATLPPSDVRRAGTPGGHLVSRSFPELDTTVMITPPEGDGLWRIQGRAWRTPPATGSIRVTLSTDEHVLDEATLDDGAPFTFEDVLHGAWALEFRVGDGDPVVLRAGSDGE